MFHQAPFTLEVHMIIGAKGIDALPLLPSEGIDQIFRGFDELLKSGQPLEVPMSISGGDLGILLKTLVTYREVVRKMATVSTEPGVDQLPLYQEIREEAEKLITYTPSRLVIPK